MSAVGLRKNRKKMLGRQPTRIIGRKDSLLSSLCLSTAKKFVRKALKDSLASSLRPFCFLPATAQRFIKSELPREGLLKALTPELVSVALCRIASAPAGFFL